MSLSDFFTAWLTGPSNIVQISATLNITEAPWNAEKRLDVSFTSAYRPRHDYYYYDRIISQSFSTR